MATDSKESEKNNLKRCSKCGQSKPATTDEFYTSTQSSDGLHWWCRECCRKSARIRKARKKAVNAVGKEGVDTGMVFPADGLIPPEEFVGSDMIMTVDFAGHQNLLDRLEKKAAASFRTPESQILFLIHQFINTTI